MEIEKLSRCELGYLAKLAEQAERYDEMAECMKNLVKNCAAESNYELTLDERNLLSVAYKNAVGARRASWRVITSLHQKDKVNYTPKILKVIEENKIQVEKELSQICNEILELLDKYLLKNINPNDAERCVFYQKMKGDYYRYICEFRGENEGQKEMVELSKKSYLEAKEIACKSLPSTNPIRLGLVLNYSVFLYEIINDVEEAIREAKEGFDTALQEFETVSEDTYKDSTLIMQLLRDNMTLWNTDLNDSGSKMDFNATNNPNVVGTDEGDTQQQNSFLNNQQSINIQEQFGSQHSQNSTDFHSQDKANQGTGVNINENVKKEFVQ